MGTFRLVVLALIIILNLFALFPESALAAGPTYVQSNSKATGTSASTQAVTLSGVTTGNMLVLGINTSGSSAPVSGVTDSASNTYTKRVGRTFIAGGVGGSELWTASNVTGGALTVTVTTSVSSIINLEIGEYSGANTFDVGIGATGTSTSANSGNVTTTQSSEMLIGFIAGLSSSLTAGTSWTQRQQLAQSSTNLGSVLFEDQSVTSTGAYSSTATLSASGVWEALILGIYNTSPTSTPTTVPTSTPTPLPTSTPTNTSLPTNTPIPTVTPTPAVAGCTNPGTSYNGANGNQYQFDTSLDEYQICLNSSNELAAIVADATREAIPTATVTSTPLPTSTPTPTVTPTPIPTDAATGCTPDNSNQYRTCMIADIDTRSQLRTEGLVVITVFSIILIGLIAKRNN